MDFSETDRSLATALGLELPGEHSLTGTPRGKRARSVWCLRCVTPHVYLGTESPPIEGACGQLMVACYGSNALTNLLAGSPPPRWRAALNVGDDLPTAAADIGGDPWRIGLSDFGGAT